MLIGQGFDVHRFAPERQLILGGVTIEHPLGLAAHSDGDVVIHALCDALLGAAALGDIGHHFPDNSAEFLNIDSRILLRRVIKTLQEHHLSVHNADLTIVAQAPKLASHIALMRQHLANDVQCTIQRMNVKATTTEWLGFTGRGEGIAAFAVVLLTGD
ncbi:2-C-methyl-D-erythritol 2,4-cyclodiphosphate synthase [Rhodoferax sp. 4810]|uniref:2-C-methyl-D-erythritol 2,4-cyclodiphosphate synthase n=1 Tax=Thiospirillum jenense TaxID=1653858 RepID=A0A839HET8_9GAMM|nr:2-C-methyl-D-erythritol 2,4-cyclodiphosphate synthase [Thiospirillum jenense]MBB1072994.1 2-C-methyl-D-erythritol 2,4-cyclodiphosphate synthase [Rhodoferax jenense]MBB1124942.1 2-C-methyl-D-erythritol 2,4-cyclodiphosphate synthase [Thiospirillum jenense]